MSENLEFPRWEWDKVQIMRKGRVIVKRVPGVGADGQRLIYETHQGPDGKTVGAIFPEPRLILGDRKRQR